MLTFITPMHLVELMQSKGVTMSRRDAAAWLRKHQSMTLNSVESQEDEASKAELPAHCLQQHRVSLEHTDNDAVSLTFTPEPGPSNGVRVGIEVQNGVARIYVRDAAGDDDEPRYELVVDACENGAFVSSMLPFSDAGRLSDLPADGDLTCSKLGYVLQQTFKFKNGHFIRSQELIDEEN